MRGSGALRIGGRFGEGAAMALLVPLLLAPAFWNGFPIIYYDTGAYLLEGLGLRFLPERSPVYSLFLRFGGAGFSLWLIVVIQSVLIAFVLVETVRAVVPRLPVLAVAAIAAFLVIATGLPWYVGQVEPDCFTAVTVLALYLLAFHWGKLDGWRRPCVMTAGGFAAGVHPSHLVIAALLCVVIALVRLLSRWTKQVRVPRPPLLAPVLVCFTGLGLVVFANFGLTRQVFVSRAGASFVFARMLQDGIAMKLLEDTCPNSRYRLCAWRDDLPATADGWLWTPHSPFFRFGHFAGMEAESARMVRDALVRYPLLQFEAAMRDSLAQFVRFGTGDQIEPQEWVLKPVFLGFLPSQVGAYLSARQQRGELHFKSLSALDVAIGALALALLVLLLALDLCRRRFDAAAFYGFVLAALVANAIVCGVLSGPHDRYQSRLVWLAPFAVLIGNPLARACGAQANPALGET